MKPEFFSIILIWAVVFWIFYFAKKRRTCSGIVHHIHKKKEKQEDRRVLEFLKEFVGKDCVVYTMDGKEIAGKLLAVSYSGDSILYEGVGKDQQVINLEYVTRIREYPINPKTGKKKTIITD